MKSNFRFVQTLVCTFMLLVSAACSVNPADAADTSSLRPYFTYYQIPGTYVARDNFVSGLPPEVRVVGGGVDPPNIVNTAGTFAPADRMIGISGFFESPNDPRALSYSFLFGGSLLGPCSFVGVKLPWSFSPGYQISQTRNYYERSASAGCAYDLQNGVLPNWQVRDRMTFLAPIRRKATDGSEYEASPMVIEREGLPWITYYAGYRLGFVASESNWVATNLSKAPALATWPVFPDPRDNFELAKLPKPFVEGEVVEYVNENDFPKSPGGVFFYATSRADQDALDATANWWRTGQSFKSGGYVPVCRLYGSASPGPNTHFYSADATECKGLQANSALHYEGTPFRASRLIPGTSASGAASCPVGTIPLYRGFNNSPSAGYDPNHRYVTNRNLLTKMSPGLGWVDEGAVMCVPE